MLVSIHITSVFLLCLILQKSCFCSTSNRNIVSVEQHIGKLSDTAAYAKTLDSSLKIKILTLVKETLYRPCLKSRGVNLNVPLMQLSPDKQLDPEESCDKVDLVCIDLYRLFSKAVEPIVIKSNSERNPGEPLSNLSEESLELMELIFPNAVNFLENANNIDVEDGMPSYQKLLATLKKHYVDPFNRYIDERDWRSFEHSVNEGRAETYQALIDALKEFEENLSTEDDDGHASVDGRYH